MVSMIDLLHLIKRDECTLAFHPLTYSILDLTPKVFEILSLHKEGHSVAEIASVARIEEKEILKLFDKLEQSILSIPIPSASKSVNDKRHIYRITLHIANDCNLRCRYCYAAGGNYGQERELMSYKTADSFIDFCVQNFDVIEKIVFFGGEPLL